jgi:hypothetical protein
MPTTTSRVPSTSTSSEAGSWGSCCSSPSSGSSGASGAWCRHLAAKKTEDSRGRSSAWSCPSSWASSASTASAASSTSSTSSISKPTAVVHVVRDANLGACHVQVHVTRPPSYVRSSVWNSPRYGGCYSFPSVLFFSELLS